ncbi:MAG TPA: BadF/BadG/BcrA/BcrD ATPase family protein [Solirubrobacteraceae bacterium]
MSLPVVLAVDGGNSKTDLALVSADGAVLGLARGPLTSPHHVGLDGCLRVLEDLLTAALANAGLGGGHPVAEVGHVMLAGADLPLEERALQEAIAARGWAARTSVSNDTFAILRAGTERGWGVAVTCGAGINCVGVAPDGSRARFPALGTITGDWGGGHDVGLAAMWAAARSEDGRGPKTTLEHAVPAHFGVATPQALAEEIHLGRIPMRRVLELPPIVLAEAGEDGAGDPVAAEIVDRLAAEVVAFARVALTRLRLMDVPVEVLLGGGMMRAANGRLQRAIAEGLRAVGPDIVARVVSEPPIVGAALLGLDDLDAPADAHARLRRALAEAIQSGEELATTGSTSDG